MGSQGKRVEKGKEHMWQRTYSKTGEGKPLKKASRVEVAFKEDNWWENILDKKTSRKGKIKEEVKSNETSTEEKFFLFQSSSRGEVGNLCSEEKKSTRGKQKATVEDVTPKRPKKLPLAPASKSPTEEDCSYGWQQSCWRCSRRSAQLRLCSACQVCLAERSYLGFPLSFSCYPNLLLFWSPVKGSFLGKNLMLSCSFLLFD